MGATSTISRAGKGAGFEMYARTVSLGGASKVVCPLEH
jgi:hypothetical protein